MWSFRENVEISDDELVALAADRSLRYRHPAKQGDQESLHSPLFSHWSVDLFGVGLLETRAIVAHGEECHPDEKVTL